MRIETNKALTVAALRALLIGADDNAQIEFVRTAKPKTNGECWCGCGGETKSRFVPGHDSKFHGLAKKVARGEEAMPESFAHDEAEADFMKWHDATVVADAAKPKPEPKVVKEKAPKAAKTPKVKAVAEEVAEIEEIEEDMEEDMEDGAYEEVAEGMLDPNSDEYKALLASVTMS